MDDRKPWEKQKGESYKAFEAFTIFRDLGSNRSLQKVANELSKSLTLIRRWYTKWSWRDRVDAWDEELDRIAREKQEQERAEMAERHIKESLMLQQKIIERMQELRSKELTPNDIARWLDIAVKIERLSRGEPTEIGKQEVTLPKVVEVVLPEDEDTDNQAPQGSS